METTPVFIISYRDNVLCRKAYHLIATPHYDNATAYANKAYKRWADGPISIEKHQFLVCNVKIYGVLPMESF